MKPRQIHRGTTNSCADDWRNGVASMKPRQIHRGTQVHHPGLVRGVGASMKPRQIHRGTTMFPVTFDSGKVLQ